MLYRAFGKTGKMVSAVGMGANRFKPEVINSANGIENCAQLIVQAASLGVNFFDSAAAYSSNKCEEILRLALQEIDGDCYICGKSSSHQEKTRDAVLRHIESSLENMGIACFDFYYMWSIKSRSQYEEIMSPGGPYEGAMVAKERGLINHLCFSSHASAPDTVKIIEDGAFEGVLLSYSLLNFRENEIALKAAQRYGLGVAVMNPLGGGIIPQNAEMFKPAIMDGDANISDAALKFIYSHTEVSTILCGIENEMQLMADVKSLSATDVNENFRRTYIPANLGTFSEFCTSCGYCDQCPVDIPIPALMRAYNQTRFKSDTFIYNRNTPDLIKRGNFFRAIEGNAEFANSVNPCINCGKCEKVCTQRLPIIDRISEIYRWVEVSGVSLSDQKKRLESLISAQYHRVGFYTAGGYTAFVMTLYKKIFGRFPFEIYVFDSNPLRWGDVFFDDTIIRSPEEIPKLDLDVILISNYVHKDQIYEDLTVRFPTLNVQKLHTTEDVPWIF